MSSRPWYQTGLLWVAIGLAGFLGFGAFLDSISNAIAVVTPIVTYVGTAVCMVCWLSLEGIVKVWRPKWLSKGGQTPRVIGVKAHIPLTIFGIVVLLWVPRLADYLTPDRQPQRRAVVEVLEATDLHLGDNVYPGSFGGTYNPLTQAVYPQPLPGVVYFDKEEEIFLADDAGPTKIGQMLVNYVATKLQGLDFSAYKHTVAVDPKDPRSEELILRFEGTPSIASFGATVLLADSTLEGNFYERYAAVGFAKSFSLVSASASAGILLEDRSSVLVSAIVRSYHGGIREGQEENFYLQINEFSTRIPSSSAAARDPAEVKISIPIEAIHFNKPNYLFLYVLPWEEKGPSYQLDGDWIAPVHFRDVGVVGLEILLEQ